MQLCRCISHQHHQSGSTHQRVFRPFNPGTISGWWVRSGDQSTTCWRTCYHFSLLAAWLHLGHDKIPRPWRPLVVVPTIFFCLSLLSASVTALLADHVLPALVSMPAFLIISSRDSFRVTTSHAFDALNSSTNDESGSCSWLDLP
ncbi:hypothetical protein DPMN_028302 [Dreissena polymorpha]|uniref:Uncharacterized protein n=1 Tax=Dreissena polymorpha TaxID=45954 RepID=A0A9D4LX07_DREPO|nr:hypothetical protein DPMN_028302 [Dreissena polymorpha]